MLKKIILFIFFIQIGFSQNKKYKFTFQLDNRFSSIQHQIINIFGAKTGFQYKNLTRFGIGLSLITSPVELEFFNKKMGKTENNEIDFWYFSLFNDWILYKNKKIECFLTEQIGYGRPNFVREIDQEVVANIDLKLIVNEVSGQINYKLKNWIGFGAGVGYRNLWNKKSVLTQTFNAPIYIGKIIFYPEAWLKK